MGKTRWRRKPRGPWKLSWIIVPYGAVGLAILLLGHLHYRWRKTSRNINPLTASGKALAEFSTHGRAQNRSNPPRLNFTNPQHVCFDGKQWQRLRQAPDLIIAGTQKGGTTALYALLQKHPQIVASNLFEAHFFDMHYGILRKKFAEEGLGQDEMNCRLYKEYLERLDFPPQKAPRGRLWTFEKTPNYMIWPHVPRAILETCPWKPKVIIVLRNPIDRLYSQYQMKFVEKSGVSELEPMLNTELTLLRKFNLSNAPNISQWISKHQGLKSSFDLTSASDQERDAKDSIQFRGFGNHGNYPRYLQRGMYIYQLRRWLKIFQLHSDLMILPYERLQNDMSNVWASMLEFIGAPHFALSESELTTIYRPSVDASNRQSMPPAAPLLNSTRSFLVEFYRPYNELLADLLGEEWRGIWSEVP